MGWAQLAAATLENEHVLLRPVRPQDRESLLAIALDPEIWRYFVFLVETEADFDAFFDAGLADQAAGTRVVFHITDKRTGQAAGSMSFWNMSEKDARLEIGWSWLGRDFRGAGINRWAKFLMLRHAFEQMGAERVEFKTDRLNAQACRGLRNIGATEEGTLRSLNPMPGGRRRDAVYFSILLPEWPGVRAQLLAGPKTVPAGTAAAGPGAGGAAAAKPDAGGAAAAGPSAGGAAAAEPDAGGVAAARPDAGRADSGLAAAGPQLAAGPRSVPAGAST